MGTWNSMEGVIGEQAPPQATLIVWNQGTRLDGKYNAKMIDYLKLDVPKYKERDYPFQYVKAVKIIADELEVNDSRAI